MKRIIPSPPVHGTVVALHAPDKATSLCASCWVADPAPAWLRYDALEELGRGVGWHPMCAGCALEGKRFVLFDEALGVLVGVDDSGAAFWSAVDPAGQTSACAFESVAQAEAAIAGLPAPRPAAWQVVAATPDDSGEYVPVAELATVGLPVWTV